MNKRLLWVAVACVVPGLASSTPKGLTSSDWAAIRAEYQRHRQAVSATEGGWRARNYQLQWAIKFDGRGFEITPDSATWQWGLRLRSYGYAGQERRVENSLAAADLDRFSYQWNQDLREFYIIGAGLEHGYTLSRRPGEGASLRFHLDVLGTLRPQITQDGAAVTFAGADSKAVILYADLKVTDANGKRLPARFAREGRAQFRLEIDDRAARYPLTVDPLAQQAHLTVPVDPNQIGNPGFGSSVAVDGNTVVVGAPNEDDLYTPARGAGAVYVFTSSNGDWTLQGKLLPVPSHAFAAFGSSVAISGSHIVVGAPNDPVAYGGAAYLFNQSGPNGWTAAGMLTPPVAAGSAIDFGESVAISGDTVVVGASGEAGINTGVNSIPICCSRGVGAAWIFDRDGNDVWVPHAYLKPDPRPFGLVNQAAFGIGVAVDKGTAVVGAPNDATGGFGSVYVYTGTNGTWSNQAHLTQTTDQTVMGRVVAVSGDTLVASGSGTVFVFSRSAGVWTRAEKPFPQEPLPGSAYGLALAMSGNTLVVGSFNGGSTGAGAIFVFTGDGAGWLEKAYVEGSPPPNGGGQFGQAVGVSGSTIVVGEKGAADLYTLPVPANIVLNTSPPGLQVSTSGLGCAPGTYTTPVSLTWTAGSSCTLSTTTPQSGSTFNHWEDASTNPVRTVAAPSGSGIYTAFFDVPVTVVVNPTGAGTITGPNMNCSDSCSVGYDISAAPSFTGAASLGYRFVGWLGAGCTGTGVCSPLRNGPVTINAYFAPLDIVINTSPQGLQFSSAGTGCAPGTYTAPATLHWVPGSACTLSVATPQGVFRFLGWENGSANPVRTVTAPSISTTFSASFSVPVTVIVSPPGSGTISGPGLNCISTCTVYYDATLSPAFTAIASGPFAFNSWSGDCGGAGSCSPVLNGARSITANFSAPTTLSAALGLKTGPQNARVWPVLFSNSGPGDAVGIHIVGFTLTQTAGAVCTPVVTPPPDPGTIQGAGFVTVFATINFSGCTAAARFKLTMPYTATTNIGGISQTLTANNQFQ